MPHRGAAASPAHVALRVTAALAAALSCHGAAAQQARPLVPGIVPDAPDGASRATAEQMLRLVHVDEELGGALTEAGQFIKGEQFDRAIQILQVLIQRDDSGFYAEGGNRFISMRRKANELLGRMGPKGLKLYRALYDPQAQKRYEQAMASSRPEQELRQLAERYFHTTYGPKALETLGAIYFDRARFSQAAGCWQRLLEATADKQAQAGLLARIAVAHHLAGEPAAADRAAEKLRKHHAGATAVLGGTEQPLAAFVDRVRKLPPPAGRVESDEPSGWPGLGGVPDGLATMGPCDVVLAPRWPRDQAFGAGEDLLSKLKAGGEMYLAAPSYSPFAGRQVQHQVRLSRGHLLLKGPKSSRSPAGEVVLPGLIHPVVVEDSVILRTDEHVVAHDLLTGSLKWRTVLRGMGMVREIGHQGTARVFYSGGYRYVGDLGRYALTVGGGKVFTVYDFLPFSSNVYNLMRARPNTKGLDDGSKLAAISIARQGYLLWQVGRGDGEGDVVRYGKFLCAPTCHDGRIYVVVQHLQKYHVVCLDAEDGSTIWVSPIAQEPAPRNRYGHYFGGDPRLSVGSPPAVSDGRVFVVTNAGVVAAYGEETGEPIWAYQYDSAINAPSSRPGFVGYPNNPMAVYRPASPLIVSRDHVICLPADCDDVLAFDAATGSPLWRKSRRDQSDLSAIDADRILLSGGGLYVLQTADGSELFAGGKDLGINGRPAVTGKQVLASALGEVQALDLKTYKLAKLGLASADGYLGNLISADGKLISANMLGVCTYFSYDVAREQLTLRIDRIAAGKRPGLLLQRALLAYDAGRYDKALEDLQAARAAAEIAKDDATGSRLPPYLYLAHVALGNTSGDDEKMREQFTQAASHATTDQEKAHSKLRMAKYNERVGKYELAARLAQEIAERYGQEELVDVEIGASADNSRFGAERATVNGERLARDYIRKLLQAYGRECYAEFDAQAKAALQTARATTEPEQVLAVATRWPNSQWADDALFAAAELFYAAAQSDQKKADDLLAEARRHLYRVARMDDSPLRFSASVGLATIYARGGWVTSARKECDALRELPGDMEVAFADVRGKLSDVLKLIEAGKLGQAPRRMQRVSMISPPLRELFSVKGDDVYVLRDQEFQPVRLDEKLAVIKGGDAHLLDTTSDGAIEALSGWKGLAGIDKAELEKHSYYTPGMRLIGGLSRDGKVLVVADRKSLTGLDLVSAKVVWRQEMAKVGMESFYCMGIGSGVVVIADRTGKVSCLDAASGKLLWEASLVGGTSRVPTGPPRIAGDLVAFRHNGGRTVTCFSLSRNGRIAEKWNATRWSQCELTPDGMLVLLLDGDLTVREAGKIQQPLWQRKYDGEAYPAILAVSAELLVVSPSTGGSDLEVLPLAGGGRPLATAKAANVSGAPAIPIEAAVRGDDLFVLCTPGLSGRRKAVNGRLSSARGLNVQKFSIRDGKQQWARDLGPQGMYYSGVLPIVVGREHVVVTARHTQMGLAYYAYVLHGETGKIVQEIDLHGKGGPAQTEARRRQVLGQPVMTNGRLTVETSEGVSVHGSK